jgi:hypothetical protein
MLKRLDLCWEIAANLSASDFGAREKLQILRRMIRQPKQISFNEFPLVE